MIEEYATQTFSKETGEYFARTTSGKWEMCDYMNAMAVNGWKVRSVTSPYDEKLIVIFAREKKGN